MQQRCVVLLLLVAACGSSEVGRGGPDGGEDASSSAPDAATGTPPNDGAVPDASASPDAEAGSIDASAASCAVDGGTGDFVSTVAAITAAMRATGAAGSNALVVPAAADRDAFASQVTAILGGDESSSCSLPPSYRLVHLTDPRAGELRVVAELDSSGAPHPSLFWGTYAAPSTRPAHPRLLVVEAPHPIFDTNTEVQAADTFVEASALYFLLAGSHRCADTAASGCSGTTTACGGTAADYPISDAAHTEALVFQAVHASISASQPTLLFLQLHGNAEACPDALVSDGSGTWNDAGVAAALAGQLASRGETVGACGAGYPTSTCNLCGTDNVQARMTAGSTAACTMMGPLDGYGRFVHVEQQLSLRQTPDGGVGGYQPLIDAVLATFPSQ